ncbi:hypothetical protein V1524DRAFT_439055 [Lipomyces starkeyi]
MPSAEYENIEDLEAEVILMKESMAARLESNLLHNRIAPYATDVTNGVGNCAQLSLKSGDRIAFPLDT